MKANSKQQPREDPGLLNAMELKEEQKINTVPSQPEDAPENPVVNILNYPPQRWSNSPTYPQQQMPIGIIPN